MALPLQSARVQLHDSPDAIAERGGEGLAALVEDVAPHIIMLCFTRESHVMRRLREVWLPALTDALTHRPGVAVVLMGMKFEAPRQSLTPRTAHSAKQDMAGGDDAGSAGTPSPRSLNSEETRELIMEEFTELTTDLMELCPYVVSGTYVAAHESAEGVRQAVEEAVFHANFPMAPLMDPGCATTPAFLRFGVRSFRVFNDTQDGWLTRGQLAAATHAVFGLPMEPSHAAGLIQKVASICPEGVGTAADVRAGPDSASAPELMEPVHAAAEPIALAEVGWQALLSEYVLGGEADPAWAYIHALGAGRHPGTLELITATPPAFVAWQRRSRDRVPCLTSSAIRFLSALFDRYAQPLSDAEAAGSALARELTTTPLLRPSDVDRIFATMPVPNVDTSPSAIAAGGASLDVWPRSAAEAVGAQLWDDGAWCNTAAVLRGRGHPFGPGFPWTVPHVRLPHAAGVADLDYAAGTLARYGAGYRGMLPAAEALAYAAKVHRSNQAADGVEDGAEHAGSQEESRARDAADSAMAVAPVRCWALTKHQWLAVWAGLAATKPSAAMFALYHTGYAAHSDAAARGQAPLKELAAADSQLPDGTLQPPTAHMRALRAGAGDSAHPGDITPAQAASREQAAGFAAATAAAAGAGTSTEPARVGPLEQLLGYKPIDLRTPLSVQAAVCERMQRPRLSPASGLAFSAPLKAAPFLPAPVRRVWVFGSERAGKSTLIAHGVHSSATFTDWRRAAQAAVSATEAEAYGAAGEDADAAVLLSQAVAHSTSAAMANAQKPLLESGLLSGVDAVPEATWGRVQHWVMRTPRLSSDAERSAAAAVRQPWEERLSELAGYPSILVITEVPADAALAAAAAAAEAADVAIIVANPSQEDSMQFAENVLLQLPDRVPTVVVQAKRARNVASQAPPTAAQLQRYTQFCDLYGLDAEFIFEEGVTSAAMARSSLWKAVAQLACEPDAENPMTPQRVARARAKRRLRVLGVVAGAAVLAGVVWAGYQHREALADAWRKAVKSVPTWFSGTSAPSQTRAPAAAPVPAAGIGAASAVAVAGLAAGDHESRA